MSDKETADIFSKDPINFLLSNALRVLDKDKLQVLTQALAERCGLATTHLPSEPQRSSQDCLNNNKPYGRNWSDFLLPDQMEFLFKAMSEYRNAPVSKIDLVEMQRRCDEALTDESVEAYIKDHPELFSTSDAAGRASGDEDFKYTKAIGDEVIWFLSKIISNTDGMKLIGSLSKTGKSNNDIDVLIPRNMPKGGVSESQFVEMLKLKLGAQDVIPTDWGGFYFKNTHYGDIDIFFSDKEFTY